MLYHTRPTGGLYAGKRLLEPPRVTEVRAGAPARIVFVTDLHLRAKYLPLADEVLSRVRALRPELLLLGGDMAEYDEGCRYVFERLSEIPAPLGKFAVPGNNENHLFSGDRAVLSACMKTGGVTLLVNGRARVQTGGRAIAIAGVDEAYTHTPDATGLFEGSGQDYRILLSHAPHAYLLDQCRQKPHLMLSGHTHGGQINVLGLTCYEVLGYENWYRFTHLSGVKRVGETLCVVSNGIGVSKYPVRFGARPEIHLIT